MPQGWKRSISRVRSLDRSNAGHPIFAPYIPCLVFFFDVRGLSSLCLRSCLPTGDHHAEFLLRTSANGSLCSSSLTGRGWLQIDFGPFLPCPCLEQKSCKVDCSSRAASCKEIRTVCYSCLRQSDIARFGSGRHQTFRQLQYS